jgi:glutamate N-acetyltransferase/amino-acid N-acetyltransferase
MSAQDPLFSFLEHGYVTTPRGWRAAAFACGMRYSGRADLALVMSDTPCTAAALFTNNAVQAAHIHYDRALMQRSSSGIQAVMVNSGSANACTGQAGIEAAATTARALEQELGLPTNSAFVMSTGVIGSPLPAEKMLAGIHAAVQKLDAANGPDAALAIMTTDTRPKQCAVQVDMPGGGQVHIGGMAKGSGMIHPNMGTMLGVITTDAALSPAALDVALRYACDRSFNCISIDGDTSTNDTLLALANGQAGQSPIEDIATPAGQVFLAALTAVCQYLAREVVRDGEGASRLVTITVRGAASYAEAHQAAMSVARSPLVKTALFAADPYAGRAVCALGYSGVTLDPNRMVLYFAGVKVFEHGMPTDFDEKATHRLLDAPEIDMMIDLGIGDGIATVWTCDFSYEYIKINSEYRS